MPTSNETTTKFKVDISELKAGITEANRQIKLANAQFKAAASGMDNWEKSASGVSAKINSLKTVLSNQEKVLQSYEKQLELITSEYGDNSAQADNMRIKIANQQAVVNNTKSSISQYESQLKELKETQNESASSTENQNKAIDKLKSTIDSQESKLASLKSEYANVVLEQGKNSDSAKALAKEISELSGDLKDNRARLEEVDRAADEFDQSLDETTGGGLSAFTVALGNLAANVISTAVGKLKDMIANTIEVGKTFESSMSNVAALSGASADELNMLRETAKKYGSETKFSASEAADALGYMALAGWDANTSAKALGGVLDLAAASNMDLAEASDMVTDYMSAFNMEADKSSYFADILAYAQAHANTTVAGLGEAFKNCAANMNAAGQDVETTTSLLSMMANQGLKGSEAGTALTAVMRDMTAKMKDGSIEIGNTSVQVMDASGNYRDMTDILKDVESATHGMGDAEKAAALSSTFTSDSIKGLNLILNAGVGNAEKFEKQLRNSGGTAKQMSKIMNDNLNGDMTALNSKLEATQIAIYEKFEPALRKGVGVLDKLLDAINFVVKHSTEFTAALAGMATAIASYIAYTTALKVMENGWKALTIVTKAQAAAQAVLNVVMSANPIGLIIAAIAGLVAAFVLLWNKSDTFRNFWIGLWESIKGAVAPVVDTIKNIFENIIGFFQNNWQSILAFMINPFAGLFKYAYDNFEGFRNFVDGFVEGIKAIFSTIADWVNTNVFQPIMAFFQVVIDFFTTSWNVISQLGIGCWNAIKIIWSLVASWFKSSVIDPVTKFFTSLWNGIQTAASIAWNFIKSVWSVASGWFNSAIIQPVANFFAGMWGKLRNGASQAWEGIKSVFSPVVSWFQSKFSAAWQAVKNVFSTGGRVFEGIQTGIVSAFKTVVNAIIRGINNVIAVPFNAINNILDRIRGVSIAGMKPFSGLISRFSVPQIPQLARGGILEKGQVGLLEGNGAEAVVPLENNAKWIAATARALKQSLYNEGVIGVKNGVSAGGTTNNYYNYVQNNTSPKALSRLDIYRQTKNQLRFATGGGFSGV